jgi:hypothetical protein
MGVVKREWERSFFKTSLLGLTNVWKTQGVLLLLILSGADTSSTFSSDAGVSRTKAYLMFILAFAAITNFVVSFCPKQLRGAQTNMWVIRSA